MTAYRVPAQARRRGFFLKRMAVLSSPFGPVTLTGTEAMTFSRLARFWRGTRAAAEAAFNGRRMVAEFERGGVVAVELRPRTQRPDSEAEPPSPSRR